MPTSILESFQPCAKLINSCLLLKSLSPRMSERSETGRLSRTASGQP